MGLSFLIRTLHSPDESEINWELCCLCQRESGEKLQCSSLARVTEPQELAERTCRKNDEI